MQAQIDLALNPQWGNLATDVASIRVPAGTTIFDDVTLVRSGTSTNLPPNPGFETDPSGHRGEYHTHLTFGSCGGGMECWANYKSTAAVSSIVQGHVAYLRRASVASAKHNVGVAVGGANLLVDMLPGVGDGKAGLEALSGVDALGNRLSAFERGVIGFATLLTLGNEARAVLRGGRGAVNRLAGAVCSFSAGTEVLMADQKTKPISEVGVGDWVYAWDPETGEEGPRQVTHTWEHTDVLYDLRVEGGILVGTEDHPFWNATDQAWQPIEHFDSGDLLATPEGEYVAVTGVDWTTATTATAYNLTVDDIHTYHVNVGDHPILVHNTCATNTATGVADEVPAFARSQYGRVPAAERAAALETTPTCPYCGTNPSSQVDHITALRQDWGAGGWADDFATRTARVNDPGNLIGACASCNSSKGAW